MNKDHLNTESNPLVTRCWADESFKQRLLADPVGTLKAEGFKPPPGLTIRVFENTPQVYNLVLPAKPFGRPSAKPAATNNDLNNELSDQQLEAVAGGNFSQDVKKFFDSIIAQLCQPTKPETFRA